MSKAEMKKANKRLLVHEAARFYDALMQDMDLPFYDRVFIDKLCRAMEETPYKVYSLRPITAADSLPSIMGLSDGASIKEMDLRLRHFDLMRQLHDHVSITDDSERVNAIYTTMLEYYNYRRPWWQLWWGKL
jgi:hypothetical protein